MHRKCLWTASYIFESVRSLDEAGFIKFTINTIFHQLKAKEEYEMADTIEKNCVAYPQEETIQKP
jgi:hypothetical protein